MRTKSKRKWKKWQTGGSCVALGFQMVGGYFLMTPSDGDLGRLPNESEEIVLGYYDDDADVPLWYATVDNREMADLIVDTIAAKRGDHR